MSTSVAKKRRTLRADTITLAHGSGGKAMRDLIEDVFVGGFANDTLAQLEDQARFDLGAVLQGGAQLAMTTDSYVVDPLFFPGGDIGKLAVKTGVWPLKEYIDGEVIHTKVPRQRVPVEEYLKLQGRFNHLFKPQRNDALITEIQSKVDRYWEHITQQK